ncbi:tail fiber domain-containing protein [Desertivirga arenae]|uniref:tail fiber domain-containing protein n=1 Tax=Desertivirga arenae TaxID=2810309 RepID=UPI001A973CFB|nr:tail fiber domain-containing protein [Pedobacter sp. SYSU D00823]
MIKFYALFKSRVLNRRALTILGLLACSGTAFSQNVGINATGNAPHSSAGLDVSFTDKGLLIPRVKLKSTRDTETISSPEVSLLIYNTEAVEDVTPGYYYFDGSAWQRLAANSSSSNWNFSNGTAYFSGNLGIGVSNPAYRLHVDGADNPLFLRRVQQGTTSDSVLTIADGIVRKLPFGSVATSQWNTSGSDISFSNGNVGIGVSTNLTSKLQIESSNNSPLNIKGLASGNTGDEILTITSGGVVRKLPQKSLAGSSQWTTLGTDITYSNGNVGIGTTEPTHPLHLVSDTEPLKIEGLSEGTSSDAILTITDEGVVQQLPFSTISPWSVAAGPKIFYTAGSVGIGTSSPSSSYKLSVRSPKDPVFLWGLQEGNAAVDSTLTISSGIIKKVGPSWNLNGNTVSSQSSFLGTKNEQPLIFKTNDLQAMVIDSDGSVGIGSSPTFSSGTEKEKVLIDIGPITTTSSSTFGATGLALKGNINSFMQLNVQNIHSGSKASTDIVATSNLSTGENYIDMGINSTTNGQNKWGSKSDGYLFVNRGDLLLGTNTADKNIYFLAGTEKKANANMIISNDGGTVAIGTATIDTTVKLQVNGHAVFTTYSTSSDRRLKRNIQPLKHGLNAIQKLEPVSYNWIDPKQSTKTQIGLIAQDARKVIPEIVLGDEDKGKLSINYTELIPVLINAIKEQQQKIDSQQKQIDELKELIKQK